MTTITDTPAGRVFAAAPAPRQLGWGEDTRCEIGLELIPAGGDVYQLAAGPCCSEHAQQELEGLAR